MLRIVPQTETPNITINLDHKCILCANTGVTTNRFCISCTTDSLGFKVPHPGEFYDEKNREVDFLLSPEISAIAYKLMQTYESDFEWILEGQVDFFWKKKGGEKNGRRTLGQCKKITGTEKFYSGKDYIIWLAADGCFSFDYYKITALIFHELKHIQYAVSPEVVGHDLEVFAREIEIFGDWKSDIAMVRKAYERSEQLSLFR
jgi:hypothetical protein